MPNPQINPSVAQALGSAFGGQPQVQPTPSASADPGMLSSLYQALIGHGQAEAAPTPKPQENVDPYSNFANKATGQPFK